MNGEVVGIAAVGYLTSTGAVRMDDEGLRAQTTALEAFCFRRGWTLESLVHEIEPARGRCLSRPGLRYALERIERGEASCLVVTELGRLCRSVAHLHTILAALEGRDGRLVSLAPAIDTGTSTGRAAAEIVSAIGAWERARAAERSRNALSAARASGAVAPTIQPELKRQITRMRGAGMTLQAIVDELNESGVPTVRGGATWRPSSVQAAIGYKRPARA
jgi:DNA invertase Pin-like site-specific DNA recombinase